MIKRIAGNIFHLSFVKGLELALPFLSIPILIHSLGINGYGELVYAQTVVSFFAIIVNFGFDDVGIKLISSASTSKERNQLAIVIYGIKFFLFLVSFVIYFSFVFSFENNKLLYSCSFLLVVNSLIDPYWFFQGVERLGFFSISSLITKACYFLSIVFFIKSSDDIYIVPILQFSSYFLGNLIALYFLLFKLRVFDDRPSFQQFSYCINSAKYLFVSNIILAIKDKTSSLIIGGYIGKEALGIFDLILKIISVVIIPFNIINTALFPTFSREHSDDSLRKLFISSLLLFVCVFILSIPIIWFFIPELFPILGEYRSLIQLSMFVGLFYGISFMFARNVFVARGMVRELFYGVFLTTLFYVFLVTIIWMSIGFSVACLILITIATYFFEALYRGARGIYILRKYY